MARKSFTPIAATYKVGGKNLEALKAARTIALVNRAAAVLTDNQVKVAAERAASLAANGWADKARR